MKALVLGHRGMVGSSLLRTAPSNVKILTLGRNELDITNELNLKLYLENQAPDLIILAAAKVGGIAANSSDQKSFLLENLRIQQAVISAADKARIKNFVFLGSSCVYPRMADQPIKESYLLTGPLEPTNEGYAIAKIAGIKLCEAIANESGRNFYSVMPSNLFGPNDNFNLETSHVPAALLRKFHEAKINNEDFVSVWGTGEPYREFLYVDNFSKAIWFLTQGNHAGDLINIGTGMDIKIKDFAKLISLVTGFKGEVKFDTSKPDGAPRKMLDINKLTKLGWSFKSNLEEELRATYNWFLEGLQKGEVRGY